MSEQPEPVVILPRKLVCATKLSVGFPRDIPEDQAYRGMYRDVAARIDRLMLLECEEFMKPKPWTVTHRRAVL